LAIFDLPPALAVYTLILTALFGLCLGSFLNCFAFRYVFGGSVLRGRSRCAACGHELTLLDLIPLFSWLFLRGRCRRCGTKISARYLLAELLCSVAFVAVVLKFGLTLDAARFLLLFSLLLAASMADLWGGLIPDRLIIIGAVAAFIFALFTENIPLSLLRTLIGGLSISLPLLLLVLLFDKIMKRESMGGGDIKLLFLIGLYFDWKLNLIILILACIIGILMALILNTRGKSSSSEESEAEAEAPEAEESQAPDNPGAISFAPALSLAALVAAMFGQSFLDWYLNLFL
jgi:prepilin signal peptidase PulO-like enzyme (type II secretory pathway)